MKENYYYCYIYCSYHYFLIYIYEWGFFFIHYSTAPVTRTSVQIAGGQPILNHTFTLICETTGSVKSLIWMYNWSPLVEDSTKFLCMDNTTLTFSPIVLTDNGNYQCVASNPLSNNTGGFTLEYYCEFCISILKILCLADGQIKKNHAGLKNAQNYQLRQKKAFFLLEWVKENSLSFCNSE